MCIYLLIFSAHCAMTYILISLAHIKYKGKTIKRKFKLEEKSGKDTKEVIFELCLGNKQDQPG